MAVDAPLLAQIAAVDGRRIDVGMTLVADHLYVDVSGRTIDGPLHRGAH